MKRRKLFESKPLLVASPPYLNGRPAVEKPADLLAYMRPSDVYHWRFCRKVADQENHDEDLEILPRHVSNNGMALLDPGPAEFWTFSAPAARRALILSNAFDYRR